MEDKMTILCVSNSYEQKYYLNPEFMGLPKTVKDDLQIMSVLFTEDVGGILTFGFEPDGTLTLNVTCDEGDLLFDEIGSELKIKEIQRTRQVFLENLETYFRVFFLGEKIEEVQIDDDSFDGWYTDEALTTPFTALDKVHSDLVLYAKWN